MLDEFFIFLTKAVENAGAVAFAASFVWGVCSVVLSPCHLASIPLIVGFIDEQGCISMRRAFGISTVFAVGILITIAAIGVITGLAGRIWGDVGPWGNYVMAGILFLAGLHLLGVIPMPFTGPGQVNMKRKGPMAAFLLGLIFGVALGPCTFAYMIPMLTVTFRLAADRWLYGAALLGAYGLGHCAVIVLAGTCTELVQRYLNWNERSKGSVILKRVCGLLVLLSGLWMLYTS
ncbi:MAG: cytochrome C biogenesis protein [Phycisphaerae bacterium]|nr:cytochrome C biogenesis protein [Phycisphaerae bacterium]